MRTSFCSVFPEIASGPLVASSSSSYSVSSKNADHPVPVQALEGHENTVICVCFCAENKVVSGSVDHTLRVWNRETGTAQVLSGHTDTVWEVDVSLDGKMVVSGSADVTMMHVCRGRGDEVYSVKFSPDSSRIVSGSSDNTVRVLSVETGELVFEPIECHGGVECVRYSPSGDRIASGTDSVQIWNAGTGRGEVIIWNSVDGDQLRMWKAHDGSIRGLSLSPTVTHCLGTSSWNENTNFIFDISTGNQVAALEHDQDVGTIAFSPSGRLIATVCRTKLYLWEAPASEDPKTTRPAIPPAAPSRNDGKGLDPFLGQFA
ncbi:hypothetical protein PAXRUDRAFT_34695 [Paxillus rubicundulus Ve08.2h10]|uniref:Uncharacterized protein n=1 Tax=Paxillus rubicundulus Ve08.2h10 TaxID=930991 RepID=A0A0D0DTQ1_9AGAM|nr:hypothetical protein PAXRUDRAFT_34695 [Paxillus rubicundulus Ve08.2h10]